MCEESIYHFYGGIVTVKKKFSDHGITNFRDKSALELCGFFNWTQSSDQA